MKKIPLPLFKKIITHVPILTVDILIAHRGKFLLLKRASAPQKGKWWTVGGRVEKGETPEKAVIRKAKEEVGVKVRIIQYLGHASFKEHRWGIANQNITMAFLVKPVGKVNIHVDETSKTAEWFSKIPKGLNSEVRKFIKTAGFQ